jgi:hypothetical protein
MSLLQNYKDQLRKQLSNESINRYSSYMNTMVSTLLHDRTKTPIDDPERSAVLINYCLDGNARTLERKSYLLVIQSIYLQHYSKEIDSNINKLKRSINEGLFAINDFESAIGKSSSDSKNMAISNLHILKDNFNQNKQTLASLVEKKKSIVEEMIKINKYSDQMREQQKIFEKKVQSLLATVKDTVLSKLEVLYETDQNNHLSGFVFFIKETYKKSLHGLEFTSLFEDIAINTVETMLLLPKTIQTNTVLDDHAVSRNWFLGDLMDKLVDGDKIFLDLKINVNDPESLLGAFNYFLAFIIGIHKTIAIYPEEQSIQVDFVRKMSSLDLVLGVENV